MWMGVGWMDGWMNALIMVFSETYYLKIHIYNMRLLTKLFTK
jgi:hypothetical protein